MIQNAGKKVDKEALQQVGQRSSEIIVIVIVIVIVVITVIIIIIIFTVCPIIKESNNG